MIKFILKKKRLWGCILLAIVYFVLIPYQKNLIRFFGSAEAAKVFFWKSTFLYHCVLGLAFMFQAALQLMDTEVSELCIMWKKQIVFILGGVFVLYQILVSPIYIWYAFVYPKDLFNLIILLLAQMASVAVFYMIALMSHKTIVGFLVVFIALLLAFH